MRQLLEWQATDSKRTSGQAYLRLLLDEQTTALLPMTCAQEVLVAPVAQVTPMPNMPDCILGLLNQRSRIFWVVDLSQLLELQPLEPDLQQYNVAIVRIGDIPLGLAVRDVKGVMRLQVEQVQSPIGSVAAGLTPYLQGCLFQEREVLLVLDAAAIVHSPMLHTT